LASPDNPLTARVFVNRLWQRHFGDGLVGTENDFGIMGDTPSHPELLDWLARRFIASGWKIKDMHRLMVLSNVYQTSSAWNESAHAKDSANRWRWRWQPRRLEAEAIRDSALAVSGRLNAKMYGPSVFPPIPRSILEGQSMPGHGWGKSDPQEASRRSIYVFVKRAVRPPELDLLDFPDTTSADVAQRRLHARTGGAVRGTAGPRKRRGRGKADSRRL
jgi:hypothetical protein